jgi:hypothetical protein
MTEHPTKPVSVNGAGIENEEHVDDYIDYTPSFSRRLLDNPCLWPSESLEDFELTFSEFEIMLGGRAKTKLEFVLVGEATKLTFFLDRCERAKSAILSNQNRPAAERLLRKTHEAAAMQNAEAGLRAAAHLDADKYFTDPAFKAAADRKFQAAGYAAEALLGEAFLLALPQLAVIERQMASAQKRLIAILKDLEASYARRKQKRKTIGSEAKIRAAKQQ